MSGRPRLLRTSRYPGAFEGDVTGGRTLIAPSEVEAGIGASTGSLFGEGGLREGNAKCACRVVASVLSVLNEFMDVSNEVADASKDEGVPLYVCDENLSGSLKGSGGGNAESSKSIRREAGAWVDEALVEVELED